MTVRRGASVVVLAGVDGARSASGPGAWSAMQQPLSRVTGPFLAVIRLCEIV